MAFILPEKSVEKEINNKRLVLKSLKTETIAFLALTFGLTFLLNLIMWVNRDSIMESVELLSLATRVQMIIPAFSAIILNIFIFKTKTYTRKSKILLYCFLVLVALYIVVFALRLISPVDITSIEFESIENLGEILVIFFLNLAILILTLGWIALVFAWNLKSDSRKDLKVDKLSFGKPSYYILFSLFFFSYFVISTILNYVFNLGSPPSEPVELGSLLFGFAAIFFGPILAFPTLFGEEYGWRIFLQDKLASQYSRLKAVLLVGLVWGFWHIPKIFLEGPYLDYPVLGISVYMISIILISIPLGLGTFKSKSVWLAAYLHGIFTTPTILATYFYNPGDLVYSFGLGLYGLPVLGALILVFLKSKEWKERR